MQTAHLIALQFYLVFISLYKEILEYLISSLFKLIYISNVHSLIYKIFITIMIMISAQNTSSLNL